MAVTASRRRCWEPVSFIWGRRQQLSWGRTTVRIGAFPWSPPSSRYAGTTKQRQDLRKQQSARWALPALPGNAGCRGTMPLPTGMTLVANVPLPTAGTDSPSRARLFGVPDACQPCEAAPLGRASAPKCPPRGHQDAQPLCCLVIKAFVCTH